MVRPLESSTPPPAGAGLGLMMQEMLVYHVYLLSFTLCL